MASTPSRESHDVRHCENARQARSGRPRCAVDDKSPAVISSSASPKPKKPSHGSASTQPMMPTSASQTSSP